MIPLIKNLDVDEINTSLIAIRKLLNNVGITETNITNIIGKDYDAKIQELEEKVAIDDCIVIQTTKNTQGDNLNGSGKSWKIPNAKYYSYVVCQSYSRIGSPMLCSQGIDLTAFTTRGFILAQWADSGSSNNVRIYGTYNAATDIFTIDQVADSNSGIYSIAFFKGKCVTPTEISN